MHEKLNFLKLREEFATFFIEATNICSILPKPAVYNGLTVAKL